VCAAHNRNAIVAVCVLTATPERCIVEDMQLRLSRNASENKNQPATRRWYTRLLAAGFLFFLIKGLVWLAVGGVALAGIL
jgi:hypothetical protein